jgi:ABC-type tungstate transport system substrate-binding protein
VSSAIRRLAVFPCAGSISEWLVNRSKSGRRFLLKNLKKELRMILRKVGLLLFVMLAASAALGRYGFFYGPGTWYTNAGDMGEQVRQR